LDDLERLQGGRLNAIKNWFKYIKTFDGKKPNEIHYNEKIFPAEKALEVIEETHSHWQALAKKKHSSTHGLVEKQKKFNFWEKKKEINQKYANVYRQMYLCCYAENTIL